MRRCYVHCIDTHFETVSLLLHRRRSRVRRGAWAGAQHPYVSAPKMSLGKVKVKSAYEPSGPSGRSLSRFPWHEATRNISTPPWMGCQSIAGLPPALNSSVPIYTIHLGGERHRESKVSCLRTQRNVPGHGSNPEGSLRSRAH